MKAGYEMRAIDIKKWQRVVHLRDVEKLTYKEVGQHFGIDYSHARSLYEQATRNLRNMRNGYVLTIRAINTLRSLFYYEPVEPTPERVAKFINKDNGRELRTIPNCGSKTYYEILEWIEYAQQIR